MPPHRTYLFLPLHLSLLSDPFTFRSPTLCRWDFALFSADRRDRPSAANNGAFRCAVYFSLAATISPLSRTSRQALRPPRDSASAFVAAARGATGPRPRRPPAGGSRLTDLTRDQTTLNQRPAAQMIDKYSRPAGADRAATNEPVRFCFLGAECSGSGPPCRGAGARGSAGRPSAAAAQSGPDTQSLFQRVVSADSVISKGRSGCFCHLHGVADGAGRPQCCCGLYGDRRTTADGVLPRVVHNGPHPTLAERRSRVQIPTQVLCNRPCFQLTHYRRDGQIT